MSSKGSYRSIYSVLLDDPDYRRLSSDARLVLLSLKVTRLNNPAGIFLFGKGGIETLREQTKLSRNRELRALAELERGKWLFHNDPVIWIRNSLQFEPTFTLSNQKHRECVHGILRSLPTNSLVVNFCSYYNIPYPFDTPAMAPRSTETETETETETAPDTSPESNTENERSNDAKTLESSADLYQTIIDDLNQITGSNYRATSLRTRKLIEHLLREGYGLGDFHTVHQKKFRDWHGDPKMRSFLRPETLYGPKFETYLGQSPSSSHSSTGEQTFQNAMEALKGVDND